MSRLSVVQRTQEWRDARLHGIGSSEAAAALGMSRWESPARLWAVKLRLVAEREPSIAMIVGTATEDANAELYTKLTGRPVIRQNHMRRSDRFPWMQASIDRRARDRVVELKWSERAEGYGQPGTDEVPDEVLLQVLHQMIVMDLPVADISLIVGGRRHRLYTVERDPVAVEETVERERLFWRAVEDRREPDLLGPADSDRDYLTERYPRGDGVLLEADDEARELLLKLRALARNAQQVDVAMNAVREQLRGRIRGADGITAEGIGTLRWYRWPAVESTSDVTDWPAVSRALPELLAASPSLLEEVSALIGIHTNRITTVTKRAGSKLGPAVWDDEEEVTDAA